MAPSDAIKILNSDGSLDLVFDPTLALTRFPEDLLLRYAMITAASCSLLTWIPSPVSGLDLQPRTYLIPTCYDFTTSAPIAKDRKSTFLAPLS